MDKILIAHRSGPVDFPEQTVESAKQAMQLGADMVEIDLRFSKDKKIIICHDDNTLRVFGIDKKTSELTAREFCSLTHKDNPLYHGHLLSDYISSSIKPLLLHIKEGGENLPFIMSFLDESNYLENVTIGSSNIDDIKYIKANFPYVQALAFIKSPSFIEESIEAGADIIRLWEGNATRENILRIKSRGKKCCIMVGNVSGFPVGETSEEFLKYILNENIDALLINDITIARALMKNR